MKHSRFVMTWAMITGLVLLAGCNAYHASPGPVLKSSLNEESRNQIVTFTVYGKGVEPEAALTRGQARLMAERAAVADGYRQFVEKLQGVYVDAFAQAGFGTIEKEYLRTRTQAVLRGVEIREITHGEYGIATAVMVLSINFTRQGMIWWPEGLAGNVNFTTASATVSDAVRSDR